MTKKYHNKEFGIIKIQDISNKSEPEIKSLINKKAKAHSDNYFLTMPINLKDRAVAASEMSTQMTIKLRDQIYYKMHKNFFEIELEKELKNCIRDLSNIVNRYYNSSTFREQKIFSPDIYKLQKETEKANRLMQNIIQLEKELEEKEKTFLG
jgi:macrodomain Ter protein organizer (MatP/YcbG family)